MITVGCKLIRVFFAIMTKGVVYNGSKMIEDIHRPTNCHRQPNKKKINLKTGKRPQGDWCCGQGCNCIVEKSIASLATGDTDHRTKILCLSISGSPAMDRQNEGIQDSDRSRWMILSDMRGLLLQRKWVNKKGNHKNIKTSSFYTNFSMNGTKRYLIHYP